MTIWNPPEAYLLIGPLLLGRIDGWWLVLGSVDQPLSVGDLLQAHLAIRDPRLYAQWWRSEEPVDVEDGAPPEQHWHDHGTGGFGAWVRRTD